MATVYLNNEFLPVEYARVSVLDRGFLFGDGVYEVIPVYGGQLFRLDQHLERLNLSLAGIRLQNPLSAQQWKNCLNELVARNGGGDQSVYLQITRGPAPRDHAFPKDIHPTVFIMSNPLSSIAESVRSEGVAAVTLDDIRWQLCHIKAITLLPNILLRQLALDAGAVEAILVRNGEVTEGAASNVFVVKNGVVITPPKGPRLLPGITRDLILEIASANNVANQERDIRAEELQNADEIWFTSSTREILPVTRLDGRPVGDGHPGPVWKRMITYYQDYKALMRREGEAPRH